MRSIPSEKPNFLNIEDTSVSLVVLACLILLIRLKNPKLEDTKN